MTDPRLDDDIALLVIEAWDQLETAVQAELDKGSDGAELLAQTIHDLADIIDTVIMYGVAVGLTYRVAHPA